MDQAPRRRAQRTERFGLAGVVAALVLSACNNPGGTTTSPHAATSAGLPSVGNGAGGSDVSPSVARFSTGFDAFAPLALGSAGTGGGGAAPVLGPPYGTSTSCGDAIAGANEECDDGPGTALDACTPSCQTRDQPAKGGIRSDRILGAGRHPISGLEQGFVNTFVEFVDGSPAIGASLFNIWGQSAHHVVVSEGATPIDEANPVAAALPDGNFAIAWADFDGDGSDLGVALRKVGADGTLGPLGVANSSREFSQLNPDTVWTGSQLVVAWEDYADTATGPDLRYRLFDADLNPLSDDVALADSALPEAAVALAPFNGGWAAAYREGSADGKENVVVRVADSSFRVGPVPGGPIDDRPALVELDATHLLVVFSVGTDPGLTGTYNVPRLRYAVVDTAGSVTPASQSLDPLDDVYTTSTQVSHLSPALARGADGTNDVYLSWRSEGRPGDAAGDQIWLKYVSWHASLETTLALNEPESLIPRLCEGSIGDQRRPQLAKVGLPPSGALAIAWDDYSHSQGPEAGDPDVVVHYAPLHARGAAEPKVLTETFTAPSFSAWPAQWRHIPTTAPATVQANQGQVLWGTSGANVSYIVDHTALDVEMVTKVRFNLNSMRAGFVARLVDAPQPSFIGARVGTQINDTWRIFSVIDGGPEITVATGPVLNLNTEAGQFTNWAQTLDFFMRFRVATNPDQSIDIGIKLWLTDLPEPVAWTMHAATSNATIVNKLGNLPGRFGLYTVAGQGGRSATFDDFRATFYEGATHGDPSVAGTFTPLTRAKALYRTCTPNAPCALAEACCFDSTECASGTSCQSAQNEIFGLGSHARTCSVAHCADKKRNADEPRADCGGADCAPCVCQSALALGAAGYCSTTNNCLCGLAEGTCTATNQCLPGLACKASGLRYGFATNINVCVPFHCLNRLNDSGAGETGVDCGGDCGTCP